VGSAARSARKLPLGLAAALGAWALVAPSPAAAISLTLSFQSAGQVGSQLDVDVWVAGLGDGVPPSLRAYDIDVAFDDGLLDFLGASFDLGPSEFVLTGASQSGVGVVDANAVSLASNAEIDANEPASFVLVTLSFDVVGTGDALFSLSQLVLTGTGTSGGAIVSGCSANTCQTLSVPVAVPEPGGAWLLGLTALPAIRRARASTLSRKERA
jgi:hypothetical protein